MNPWKIITAEIRHYRLGFCIGALLIGLAVAMGIALTAQERAVRSGSAKAADRFDLIVGSPGSETQLVLTTVYLQPALLNLLPYKFYEQLANDKGVEYVAPLAFGDYIKGMPIVGTTPVFVTHNGRIAPAEGRVFEKPNEVVIGADVAMKLGETFIAMHGTPQENVIETHVHANLKFQIVGRLAKTGTPWDRAVLVPIDAIWAMHHHEDKNETHEAEHDQAAATLGPPWPAEMTTQGIPVLAVKPKSVSDAYRLRRTYRSDTSTAAFPAEVLLKLYGTLGDIRTVMSLLLSVAQGLVFVAVLLAIFALLTARRATIAVLRAMGAPPLFVFTAVWGQVALMALIGIAIGVVAGWAGAHGLAWLIADKTGVALPVVLGASEWRFAGIWALASLVLAAIPAASLYRVQVAEALRG